MFSSHIVIGNSGSWNQFLVIWQGKYLYSFKTSSYFRNVNAFHNFEKYSGLVCQTCFPKLFVTNWETLTFNNVNSPLLDIGYVYCGISHLLSLRKTLTLTVQSWTLPTVLNVYHPDHYLLQWSAWYLSN